MDTIQIKNIAGINNTASKAILQKEVVEAPPVSMPKNTPESGDAQNNLKQSKNEHIIAQVQETIEKANKVAEMRNLKVNYSIDNETKKVIIKIVDDKSNEVVRQIPPEEFLRLSAHLEEFQAMILDNQG